MENNSSFQKKLMAILVSQKTISQDEAQVISVAFDRYAGEVFEEFLIEEGLVDEFDLLRALSEYYQVPPCDVLGLFVDTELLHKFSKSFLLRNKILPIEVDGSTMVIVAANPNDESLLEKIGNSVSYDIQFQVGLAGDITDAVKEFYDESDTEISGTELDPDHIAVKHRGIDQEIDLLEEEAEENISSE